MQCFYYQVKNLHVHQNELIPQYFSEDDQLGFQAFFYLQLIKK